MSVWVEIHCDVRSEVPDPARGYADNICYGHQNDYPMSGGLTVDDAYAYAVKVAKQRGWAKRRVMPGGRLGWVCPHCLKFPPLAESGL